MPGGGYSKCQGVGTPCAKGWVLYVPGGGYSKCQRVGTLSKGGYSK